MKRDPRQILTELLVLRVQGQDDGAFTDLHNLWRHDVNRMAFATTGNPAAAAEVAQDSWIAVARGIGRLQDPACFPRWLFQIVRRRAADWVRRRKRERVFETAAVDRSGTGMEQPGRRPGQESPLDAAIATLPQAERELLGLFYELDRSVAEISEILKVPLGTVKSRLHALRERLRDEIEKEPL
jgi:RNA polymerase sigma factor (sigma-70 family)